MEHAAVRYIDADESWRAQIAAGWSELAARHMHFTDGFSILALHAGEPIGLIAVVWRALPAPLCGVSEAFIDIIEVREAHRRQGIASRLVEMATQRATAGQAYQLRAWSSDDKAAAIALWNALGFGLAPASAYPRGQEVKGYFATRVLRRQEHGRSLWQDLDAG